MYTLRKSVQWLADEVHVKNECGPYTVREGWPPSARHSGKPLTALHVGRAIPDWPKLLHLYTRLKPGKTVFEWMQEHDVQSLGIDARRFTSFGVIKVPLSFLTGLYSCLTSAKGFLRRVYRWPVLLDDGPPTAPVHTGPSPTRRRSMSERKSIRPELRIPQLISMLAKSRFG